MHFLKKLKLNAFLALIDGKACLVELHDADMNRGDEHGTDMAARLVAFDDDPVRTRRDAKGFSFIELNDGSCLKGIQVIANATSQRITGIEADNFSGLIPRTASAGFVLTRPSDLGSAE
mgnify:CR=1 FL=1